MKKTYKLQIKETSDTEVTIKRLGELLLKSGILLEYDSASGSLKFNYETDEIIKKQTRYAGRKRKNDELHMTVGEVKKLIQEKRPEEIYGMLEISRATYYRRLSQMKKKSDFEWFLE